MKNSQKTLLIVVILTIVILSAVLFIYLKYMKNYKTTPNDSNSQQTTNEDTYTTEDFTLQTEYQGENTWTYTITGTLPTPCYEYTVNEVVMESYPEQVNINMQIEQTQDICAQVIQEVEKVGTFQASEQAQIHLNVVED
jgi:hypothetical protein